jgi:hypothetical protein
VLIPALAASTVSVSLKRNYSGVQQASVIQYELKLPETGRFKRLARMFNTHRVKATLKTRSLPLRSRAALLFSAIPRANCRFAFGCPQSGRGNIRCREMCRVPVRKKLTARLGDADLPLIA